MFEIERVKTYNYLCCILSGRLCFLLPSSNLVQTIVALFHISFTLRKQQNIIFLSKYFCVLCCTIDSCNTLPTWSLAKTSRISLWVIFNHNAYMLHADKFFLPYFMPMSLWFSFFIFFKNSSHTIIILLFPWWWSYLCGVSWKKFFISGHRCHLLTAKI